MQEPQSEPEPGRLPCDRVSRGRQTSRQAFEFSEPALRASGPHRAYVVWYLENSRWPAEGVHFGPGAWLGLLSLLPSQTYRTGVDHLRRVRVIEGVSASLKTTQRILWWLLALVFIVQSERSEELPLCAGCSIGHERLSIAARRSLGANMASCCYKRPFFTGCSGAHDGATLAFGYVR
eukprot:5181289-Amphidinium_carterae.1